MNELTLEQLIAAARNYNLLRTDGVRMKEFAFTGTLSVKRDEMKTVISQLLGLYSDSVRSSTDFLLVPDENVSRSSKLREAEKRGVTIITEAEFCAMIFPTLAELQS